MQQKQRQRQSLLNDKRTGRRSDCERNISMRLFYLRLCEQCKQPKSMVKALEIIFFWLVTRVMLIRGDTRQCDRYSGVHNQIYIRLHFTPMTIVLPFMFVKCTNVVQGEKKN